jgi:tRNA-dihydrouridine synthase
MFGLLLVACPAGESEKKLNAPRVVRLLQQAGAAAVVVHGRTMEQR